MSITSMNCPGYLLGDRFPILRSPWAIAIRRNSGHYDGLDYKLAMDAGSPSSLPYDVRRRASTRRAFLLPAAPSFSRLRLPPHGSAFLLARIRPSQKPLISPPPNPHHRHVRISPYLSRSLVNII